MNVSRHTERHFSFNLFHRTCFIVFDNQSSVDKLRQVSLITEFVSNCLNHNLVKRERPAGLFYFPFYLFFFYFRKVLVYPLCLMYFLLYLKKVLSMKNNKNLYRRMLNYVNYTLNKLT